MRWFQALILGLPIAIVCRMLDAPAWTIFLASALALLPLAGWIGLGTEHVATRLGSSLGGLLNATFGNAAELIITIFALRRGLVDLVKASITGSIIGNTLLILGTVGRGRREEARRAALQREAHRASRGDDDPGGVGDGPPRRLRDRRTGCLDPRRGLDRRRHPAPSDLRRVHLLLVLFQGVPLGEGAGGASTSRGQALEPGEVARRAGGGGASGRSSRASCSCTSSSPSRSRWA